MILNQIALYSVQLHYKCIVITFSGIQSTFRSLEMHCKRRFKICICSGHSRETWVLSYSGRVASFFQASFWYVLKNDLTGINPGGVTLGISGWGCAVGTLVACVASVSSRGSSRKLGQERKKNEWQGRGKKEPLARKPHDFEKLRSHKNAASDWRGAGSVDYLAFRTSIKPGEARYLAFADLSNIFLIQSLNGRL